MSILVTGASGFLGSALIPRLLEKGHKVYALSRHPPEAGEQLIPLTGDIIQYDLGLKDVPEDIHAVQRLAAIHRLGDDKDGSIWETNVVGTRNVIDFCLKHNISHLYFTSSAYTFGRNPYERSKALCETMVKDSGLKRVTIFKPSIILGNNKHFYPGHFLLFISLLVKVHQRAELVRRRIEGTLRLPLIEPVFRMKANPDGKLNLIPIDVVAQAMAEIDQSGIFYLTHPSPPTLSQLVDWTGEFIMVKIKIEPTFTPTPLELAFEKLAAPFIPYLWGDEFPSSISAAPVTKEFIHETVKRGIMEM